MYYPYFMPYPTGNNNDTFTKKFEEFMFANFIKEWEEKNKKKDDDKDKKKDDKGNKIGYVETVLLLTFTFPIVGFLNLMFFNFLSQHLR